MVIPIYFLAILAANFCNCVHQYLTVSIQTKNIAKILKSCSDFCNIFFFCWWWCWWWCWWCWLVGWLVGWLVVWLVVWLFGWLVEVCRQCSEAPPL